MRRTKTLNQNGTILLVFIIVLPFIIALAVNYMSLSLSSFQVARLDQFKTNAQLAADAGADYAVGQFSQNNTWSGTGGEIILHNDGKIKTTYTASLSGDATTKVIAVTGKTYFPASATTPKRTVSIYVDLRPVSSGLFSVISGAGGLVMQNSSKVVGGDVFINGGITMSNSAQIGLSTSPVNVSVAHQICPNPADATYPRVCNSGENGQPITLNNTSHIYGVVKATNQTNGSGMTNTGLVAGSTVAPQALPTYDRAAQKAAVATTITGAAASCTGNQTRTWAANTKITGNVNISNQCKVTVLGDVWITGELEVKNSTELIVADSVGTNIPHIMVDGAEGAEFSNSTALKSNASGIGFEILTFYSTAICSPDCATVTGTDLANSRSRTTIALNNNGNAPNTIFYAYWTQVQLSNSGQIGAIIGQTIKLTNTGTVTFGTSTGTGETTWVVKGYRKQ
jgi:hypothetical protein